MLHSMQIGNQEKALIHVAKNQLHLDDDRYRDLLRSVCGVGSAKNLTWEQFDRLMDRLKELGFTRKVRQPYLNAPDRNASALPSPAQLKKISDLYHQLGWCELERQQGFNRRVIKCPWPQTREQANKITEALKSMVARQDKTM